MHPEAVAQAFRAAVRRVRNVCLDHEVLDDVPDPYPAQGPDREAGLLPGFLSLADTVCRVQRVEKLGRHRHIPEYDFLTACRILALLQRPDGDDAAREVYAGRCDFEKF